MTATDLPAWLTESEMLFEARRLRFHVACAEWHLRQKRRGPDVGAGLLILGATCAPGALFLPYALMGRGVDVGHIMAWTVALAAVGAFLAFLGGHLHRSYRNADPKPVFGRD